MGQKESSKMENCFLIKTCKELNSVFSKFGWERVDISGKTHWRAWDELTRPKASGGMVFKDFVLMNYSLLAKKVWRVIHHPSGLWLRVLKRIYLPTKEFVDANKGSKASWCWLSIIDGRDFLKKNLLWDISNGESLQIWDDQWDRTIDIHQDRTNDDNGDRMADFQQDKTNGNDRDGTTDFQKD
ncbi:uncharacterized mitochondrial protein AtMg00310-like [Prosopis cineraria]|uniref:uncharacterized mitochondrial protein AtMg00310-like n=1 Tax=Prosopis cineraria TaxID=364024 RepID=UPI0024109356|nr:uncharacterized mitochondrial protein AtMg00310-like [Prosopis cineraria]